jgi:hypothetical protein
MPQQASMCDYSIYEQWLGRSTLIHDTAKSCRFEYFKCSDHKQATYAQCSRLYGAALELDEQEILVTSDVDMLVFQYPTWDNNKFSIYGSDLVPPNQYPICYIIASVRKWREAFNINGRSLQKCLDDLVGVIECQDFRGCQWSLDQDHAFKHLQNQDKVLYKRAYPNTQFATKREDRDSWGNVNRFDLFDAHLPRPGYTEDNFNKILSLLQEKYPNDSFEWLIKYREDYVKLL